MAEKVIQVSSDRRETFAELILRLGERVLAISKADGGRLLSASHACDPRDPDGMPYSLVVVAEANEAIEDDYKIDVDLSGD
jgi:hypothetical protein